MANTAINLSYIGQPSPAQGQQVVADVNSGPRGKMLVGFGTTTLDASGPLVTVNFIDGVQSFGKQIILSLTGVLAASGGNSTYLTGQAATSVAVGDSVVIAGFSTSANNGTFTVQSVATGQIVVNNASGVAESNPAATLSDIQSAIPKAIVVSVTGGTQPATAALAVDVSTISATGFVMAMSANGTSGKTLSIVAQIYFAS